MALRKTGSRLVAEGAEKYIALVTRSGQANEKYYGTLQKIPAASERMARSSMAVDVALGSLAANGIQRAIGGFVNQARTALDVVSSHEKLTMSMNSLVAKEKMVAGEADNMTDALALAAPRAEELLGWVQQLAIASPFDQQGVAMAFRTALAYGFTSSEAQRLTAATIDFTTATGASGHVMDSMALALGQIKAKGKLAGQEMLQLVNTGMNVNKILEEMGYTSDDVSKGLVSADEFIGKFTETLERDFGGAAQRSSETVGGLLNSLDDLQQMGMRAFFGPAMQAMLPHVSALAEKFQEMLPYIEVAGEYLGKFVGYVVDNRSTIAGVTAVIGAMVGTFTLVAKWSAIAAAAKTAYATATMLLAGALTFLASPLGLVAVGLSAVAGVAALIGVGMRKASQEQQASLNQMSTDYQNFAAVRGATTQQMGNQQVAGFDNAADRILAQQNSKNAAIANNSRSWGENIAIQFAQGIANGIGAIITVLNQVGQMIAHWLAPGSPPRITPDIDKWGQQAMGEFYKGFTTADFGVIREAQGPLEQFFRSMGDNLSEGELIEKQKGAQSGLAQLAKEFQATGTVGQQSFQKFFKQIGLNNQEVQKYVQSVFQVQQAQEQLNQVTQKYADILNPMQAQLDGIATRRQAVIEQQRKEELKGILERAKANGDALAVELAEMELKELAIKEQMRLVEAQAEGEIGAAEKKLAAAEEQKAKQKEIVDIINRQNDLDQAGAGLEEGGVDGAADGGGAGGAAGGGGGGLPSSISDALGGLTGIDQPDNPISAGIDKLKERMTGLVEDLKAPFAGIGDQVSELGKTWLDVFKKMGTRAIEWKDKAKENLKNVSQGALNLIEDIEARKVTWRENFEQMGTIAEKLKAKFFLAANNIKERILFVIMKVQEWHSEWKEKLPDMETITADAAGFIKGKFSDVEGAVGKVTDVINKLKDAWAAFGSYIASKVFEFKIKLPEIPKWADPNSPIPLHTGWKDFGDYLKTAKFEPKMNFGEAFAPTIPANQVRTTNIYNQQQITGINNLSAEAQQLDTEGLIELIADVVQRTLVEKLR